MALAEDQDAVGELGPGGEDVAFGEAVRPRAARCALAGALVEQELRVVRADAVEVDDDRDPLLGLAADGGGPDEQAAGGIGCLLDGRVRVLVAPMGAVKISFTATGGSCRANHSREAPNSGSARGFGHPDARRRPPAMHQGSPGSRDRWPPPGRWPSGAAGRRPTDRTCASATPQLALARRVGSPRRGWIVGRCEDLVDVPDHGPATGLDRHAQTARTGALRRLVFATGGRARRLGTRDQDEGCSARTPTAHGCGDIAVAPRSWRSEIG
jgi:hypothetical protein